MPVRASIRKNTCYFLMRRAGWNQYDSVSENCSCREFDPVEVIMPNPDPVSTLLGVPKFTILNTLLEFGSRLQLEPFRKCDPPSAIVH